MNVDSLPNGAAPKARYTPALTTLLRRLTRTPARKRAATAVAVLAAGTLGSVLIIATATSAPPEPIVEKAWPVSVTTVRATRLSPQLTAYGRVESASVARLRTAIDAPVARTLVREGDQVAAGQLLIQLEPRMFELALIERQAELVRAESALQSSRNDAASAKRNLERHRVLAGIARDKLRRFESLFAKGMVPVTLLDEVRDSTNQRDITLNEQETATLNYPNTLAEQSAEVTRARALRDRARLDLLETQVRAPFAGPVLAVHVAPGDRSTAPVLMEVADAGGLEVRAAIADRHIAALRRGLDSPTPVMAQTQIDGRAVALQLRRIGQGVRTGQGSVDAFFSLAGTDAAHTPAIGSVLDIRISLPAIDQVIALPSTALYDNRRVYGINTQPSGEFRLQAFDIERVGDQLGPHGELLAVVRAPALPVGTQVLTTQLQRAISGLLVLPIQPAPTTRQPADAGGHAIAIAGSVTGGVAAATARRAGDADNRVAAAAAPSVAALPLPAPHP